MLQGMHVECVRPQARHDAGTTRPTQRLLAVSRVKPYSHSAQPIQIWRLYQGMPERAEITVHIVGGNEQNIRSLDRK